MKILEMFGLRLTSEWKADRQLNWKIGDASSHPKDFDVMTYSTTMCQLENKYMIYDFLLHVGLSGCNHVLIP